MYHARVRGIILQLAKAGRPITHCRPVCHCSSSRQHLEQIAQRRKLRIDLQEMRRTFDCLRKLVPLVLVQMA